MLSTLKDKRDAGFFTSIAGLMAASTVLDLDAFERNTKAEGLGVGPDGPAGEKNMYDADFTTLLFRFLQLTSEGHNNGEWVCALWLGRYRLWSPVIKGDELAPYRPNLVIIQCDKLLE